MTATQAAVAPAGTLASPAAPNRVIVVGIGDDGADGLTARTRRLVEGATLLAGCEKLNDSPAFKALLAKADRPTEAALTTLTPDDALAEEFTEADLSPMFKANGSKNPQTPEYLALKANGFADYRLTVTGLVERPRSYPLADLRNMPARTI